MGIDKEKFKECISEEEYFVGKYIFIPISNFFSRILIRTPVTPNQLTILWGLLMVVSSIAFTFNDYVVNIIAGVCWVIAYSLDCADGTIARYKNIRSKRGKYYDLVNHRVSYPLLMFCIGFGMWHSGRIEFFGFDIDPAVYLIVGFLAGLGMLLIMDLGECRNKAYPESMIENDSGSKNIEGKGMDKRTFNMIMSVNPLSFDNMMVLLPIFAALNLLEVFILFYGIMYPLAAFGRYVILARAIPPRITE